MNELELSGSLEIAREREWLETNGLGGFASSTLAGLNTRRYHGLLVAALAPPAGRSVLLSKLEETLVVDGERFDLSTNHYAGAVHPTGYRFLTRFRRDPYPIATYRVEGLEIDKTVCMVHGENTVVVRYDLRPDPDAPARDVRLELRPLIAFRDYHSLTHENPALRGGYREAPGIVSVAPYDGLPELFLTHDAQAVEPAGYWYRTFEYAVEQERGLDFQEDLFNPLILHFDLSARAAASVIASTERREAAHSALYLRAETERRRALLARAADEPLIRALTLAADQFIVARGEGHTVIAGYPWFTDWGRDTMIALPGLTLATGRPEIARSILLAYSRYVDQGMIPNRFPDAGEQPEYNTVDATLWYFQAVHALLDHTGDYDFVRMQLYDVLADIISWHVRGTRYGIRADEDGLLLSGAEGVQLTWMDARIGDWVVTPRRGKPVEIQALWYNALRVMEGLACEFGDTARQRAYGALAARARRSFEPLFWNEAAGCLYDCVKGEARDASVRPNQLLAISLPHTMLARPKAVRVLEVAERELLTPAGLRSVAPSDPRYAGRYLGGPRERDGIYHQGTAWPWLMGPFLTAYRKTHRTAKARRQAAQWLQGFRERLNDACLGQLTEIADGDPPHHARGCFAQAWSVAEILRAAIEVDLLLPRPHSR